MPGDSATTPSSGGRWATGWRVLAFWVATMVVLVIASLVTSHVSAAWRMVVTGAVAGLATLLLTLPFLRWEGLRAAQVGLVPERGSLARFGAGVVLGVGMAAAHVGLMLAFAPVRLVAGEPVDVSFMLLTGFGLLLLAAREEIAFRAYPLRALDARYGVATALAGTAAMFCVEHILGGSSWDNAVFGSIPGALVFGMAALASRGLALPLGLHTAWNCVDWATGGKGDDGLWRRVVEPGREQAGAVLGLASFGLVMAAAFVLLWWIGRRARRQVAAVASRSALEADALPG
ncbi:CPBP family intramembrane metalloprotease [Micromonospora sp. NBC_01655]|uniref:CPBP family intramembrane glutamic endopeptidase n=1 Tax=Micromonospora sp. NBC_01655 TaxID=2975983 RepID=UPI002254A073|nr:CPBP family intramembrane glutamic endopeptidase [Micromonospora sp. NBC_01655]MCX4474294.1 CPBP family intramembrane metalloprotease [Micromonospora sp. NBC_01655]